MKTQCKRITVMIIGTLLLLVLALAAPLRVQAASPKLNKKIAYLAKGDKLQLKITGKKGTVKWSSSNKKVATVTSKGKVLAKKTGKAKITARIGKKKRTCTIIVEKKPVNRARRLRDYVLKKGKSDTESGLIVLTRNVVDKKTNEKHRISVGASKGNTKLTFKHECTPTGKDKWKQSFTMTIDLITGKSSVKTGNVICNYQYENDYGDKGDTTEEAVISTKVYKDDEGHCGGGVKVTKTVTLTPNYNTENPNDYYYETLTNEADMDLEVALDNVVWHTGNAFEQLDAWFKSVKELKKHGITMKSVGFSKW